MSRRHRKSPVTASSWVAWQPEFDKLFRLAPADWPRPDRLQCRQTKAGYTLIAVFAPNDGAPAKVTVRLRVQDGKIDSVAGESLAMRFRTPAGREMRA